MPRQDRVTRLINFAGALQRLREAEFYARQSTMDPRHTEREIEALKQHYLDLRTALTVSDRNRLGTASFEALVAAKRIVREWRERDDEAYGHTQPKPTQKGAVTVNTINPVMVAVREALYPPGKATLIEGTETFLRLVGHAPTSDDLASMVRQLTEKIGTGSLPKGVIAFNRYCSWVTHE